jgi:hypothetical protein
MGSALGRFTALRRGDLEGQTFEIELEVGPAPRLPAFVRGYVTCTRVLAPGAELDRLLGGLAERAPALADGGRPLALVELTTHARHPLGAAASRLLVAEGDGGATIRDIGCWDPLPPHLRLAYERGGAAAQAAFWQPHDVEASMLAQLALVSSGEATP